jgi:pimeloyl-ACP methyl ester carboxylesterase
VAPLMEALRPATVQLPCGHNLMAEAPDGVLQALRAVLSRG